MTVEHRAVEAIDIVDKETQTGLARIRHEGTTGRINCPLIQFMGTR